MDERLEGHTDRQTDRKTGHNYHFCSVGSVMCVSLDLPRCSLLPKFGPMRLWWTDRFGSQTTNTWTGGFRNQLNLLGSILPAQEQMGTIRYGGTNHVRATIYLNPFCDGDHLVGHSHVITNSTVLIQPTTLLLKTSAGTHGNTSFYRELMGSSCHPEGAFGRSREEPESA